MDTKFDRVLDRLIKAESIKEVLSVRNKALEEIVRGLNQKIISLTMSRDKK
jgi:hypothetical protein